MMMNKNYRSCLAISNSWGIWRPNKVCNSWGIFEALIKLGGNENVVIWGQNCHNLRLLSAMGVDCGGIHPMSDRSLCVVDD